MLRIDISMDTKSCAMHGLRWATHGEPPPMLRLV